MVFQDYELIHTKRVNRQRMGSDPFTRRLFNAFGSWSSVYLVLASAIAGHQLRSGFGKYQLRASLRKLFASIYPSCIIGSNKSVALWVGVPTLTAYFLAPHIFGDAHEYVKL